MGAPRPRRRALAVAEEIEYDRVLFAFSFTVIGLLWLAHHSLFRLEPPEVDSAITEGDDDPHG